jgi:hypothetical protein
VWYVLFLKKIRTISLTDNTYGTNPDPLLPEVNNGYLPIFDPGKVTLNLKVRSFLDVIRCLVILYYGSLEGTKISKDDLGFSSVAWGYMVFSVGRLLFEAKTVDPPSPVFLAKSCPVGLFVVLAVILNVVSILIQIHMLSCHPPGSQKQYIEPCHDLGSFTDVDSVALYLDLAFCAVVACCYLIQEKSMLDHHSVLKNQSAPPPPITLTA